MPDTDTGTCTYPAATEYLAAWRWYKYLVLVGHDAIAHAEAQTGERRREAVSRSSFSMPPYSAFSKLAPQLHTPQLHSSTRTPHPHNYPLPAMTCHPAWYETTSTSTSRFHAAFVDVSACQ